MARWVALLRGVNVGGKNKMPMAELRSLFGSLGHAAVATYVQSGNVVFDASTRDRAKVRASLERAIAERFGLDVAVVLRTHDELAAALAGNPFVAAGADLTKLHVVFLADEPATSAIASLDANRSPPDEFAVRGREVHLHCPHGVGRSKLTLDWFERRLGTKATARNWRTATALKALAEPGE